MPDLSVERPRRGGAFLFHSCFAAPQSRVLVSPGTDRPAGIAAALRASWAGHDGVRSREAGCAFTQPSNSVTILLRCSPRPKHTRAASTPQRKRPMLIPIADVPRWYAERK